MLDYRYSKKKMMDEQCAELEKHETQGKMDRLYRNVPQLTNRQRNKLSLHVHGKDGNVLTVDGFR